MSRDRPRQHLEHYGRIFRSRGTHGKREGEEDEAEGDSEGGGEGYRGEASRVTRQLQGPIRCATKHTSPRHTGQVEVLYMIYVTVGDKYFFFKLFGSFQLFYIVMEL